MSQEQSKQPSQSEVVDGSKGYTHKGGQSKTSSSRFPTEALKADLKSSPKAAENSKNSN